MKHILLLGLALLMSLSIFSQKEELSKAFKNNNSEKVISISEEILKNNSNDAVALLSTGRVYNILFEYEKAIPYLIKLSQNATKDWQFSWSYIELLESYFATGSKEKTLECYKKVKQFEGTKNSNNKLKKNGIVIWFRCFL